MARKLTGFLAKGPNGSDVSNVRDISSIPKMSQQDFEAEMMARIERLKQQGKMPTLSQVREDIRPFEKSSSSSTSPTKKV